MMSAMNNKPRFLLVNGKVIIPALRTTQGFYRCQVDSEGKILHLSPKNRREDINVHFNDGIAVEQLKDGSLSVRNSKATNIIFIKKENDLLSYKRLFDRIKEFEATVKRECCWEEKKKIDIHEEKKKQQTCPPPLSGFSIVRTEKEIDQLFEKFDQNPLITNNNAKRRKTMAGTRTETVMKVLHHQERIAPKFENTSTNPMYLTRARSTSATRRSHQTFASGVSKDFDSIVNYFQPVRTTRRRVSKPGGLVNLGNTCWLNAALQCLCSLRGFVLALSEANKRCSSSKSSCPMLAAAVDVMSDIDSTQMSTSRCTNYEVNPKPILEAISVASQSFGDRSQQDAHEFLLIFFDYISAELDSAAFPLVTISYPKELHYLSGKNGISTLSLCDEQHDVEGQNRLSFTPQAENGEPTDDVTTLNQEIEIESSPRCVTLSPDSCQENKLPDGSSLCTFKMMSQSDLLGSSMTVKFLDSWVSFFHQTTLTCCTCNYWRRPPVLPQRILSLYLPTNDTKMSFTVDQLLEQLFMDVEVEASCEIPGCLGQTATKESRVTHVPPVAIIHIARNNSVTETKKNSTVVRVPLELDFQYWIKLRHWKKETNVRNEPLVLHSALVHQGLSVDCGHFVAYVQRFNLASSTPEWDYISDTATEQVRMDEQDSNGVPNAIHRDGYLLFYTQKSV